MPKLPVVPQDILGMSDAQLSHAFDALEEKRGSGPLSADDQRRIGFLWREIERRQELFSS